MKLDRKIKAGYILLSLIVLAVGIFGLKSSRHMVEHFEEGNDEFSTIVTAVTEASSYAKRAESHLLLYIAMHDEVDKRKFRERHSTLMLRLQLLDELVRDHEARQSLEEMKSGADMMLRLGNSLLVSFAATASHDERAYPRELVWDFHKASYEISENADKLTHIVTDFLDRQDAILLSSEIARLAKEAQSHLMLFLMLGQEEDREIFLKRNLSLMEEIGHALKHSSAMPRALVIIERMRASAKRFMRIGEDFLSVYDADSALPGGFRINRHSGLLSELDVSASEIRGDGVALASIYAEAEKWKRESAITTAMGHQRRIVVIIAGAFVLSLVLGHILSSSIVRPLKALGNSARSVGRGEFETSLDISARDELGELARSFEDMTKNLREITVSRDYFHTITDSISDALIVASPDGTIRRVNRSFETMLGYEDNEVVGRPVGLVSNDLTAMVEAAPGRREVLFASKYGTEVPVDCSVEDMTDKDGELQGIVVSARDITERKRAQESTIRSLEEKQVLLAEIHHRVKNNMAIITSLLSLQARNVDDERIAEVLNESQNRIRSMSLVHEKLYQHKDFSTIDFREYVKSLVLDLSHAFGFKSGELKLVKDIDEHVSLNIDTLIPCGLILNELVTNALKHAFADAEAPELRISLKGEGDMAALTVWNNGSDLPEDIDITNAKTLGLRIVHQLTVQLEGELEIDRNSGTGIRISFRIPDKQAYGTGRRLCDNCHSYS